MKSKLIPTLLFLLILIPTINAIGISPSLKQIDFVPGEERTFTLNVVNDEKKDMDVFLRLDGGLQYYAELEEKIIHISEDEPYKEIAFTIKLPEELPQDWINTLKIIAKERFELDKYNPPSFIPELEVVSRLEIFGPFNGKHIEAKLEALDAKEGDESEFNLKIKNYGTENIDNANINYMIYSDGELIDNIKGENTAVGSGETLQFKTTWKSESIGSFLAKAVIDYDEKQTEVQDESYVGEPYIDIPDIKTELRDGILIFDMNLESQWNTKLTVKSKILIMDEELTIGESETQIFGIESLEKKTVRGFVEVGRDFKNKGDVKILLEYEDRTTKHMFRLDNIGIPYGIIFISALMLSIAAYLTHLIKLRRFDKSKYTHSM